MSSGNIFGDDDDFELLPGGDTEEDSPKQRPAPRNPAQSNPTRATGNQGLPAVNATRPSGRGLSSLPSVRQGNVSRPATSSNPTVSSAPKVNRESSIPAIPTTPRRTVPAAPVRKDENASASIPEVTHSSLPQRRPVTHTPAPEPAVEEHPVKDDYELSSRDAYDNTESFDSVPVETAPTARQRNNYEKNILAEQEERNRRAEEAIAYEDFQERYNDNANQEVRRPSQNTSPTIRTFETDGEEKEEKASRKTDRSSRKEPTGKKDSKAKKARNKKNENEDETEKPKNFAGGRKNVLVVRIISISLVALLAGLGAKSIIAPPTMPSPTQVIGKVKEGLGITAFPAEKGKAFVTEFTKIYLTVDPATNMSAAKKKILENFTSTALATDVSIAFTETDKQSVNGTPIVTNIESLDDNNAVYTVGAQVDGGSMLYLEIPVYYDLEKEAFSISGLPSFVAPPVVAELPPVEELFSDDPQISAEVKENVRGFFKEWGASSPELSLYTDAEVTIEASTGLKGALVFEDISNLKVEKKDPAVDSDLSTRKATVTVTWKDPTTTSAVKYRQNYELVLIRDDNKKWFVKDVSGAVRTNAG